MLNKLFGGWNTIVSHSFYSCLNAQERNYFYYSWTVLAKLNAYNLHWPLNRATLYMRISFRCLYLVRKFKIHKYLTYFSCHCNRLAHKITLLTMFLAQLYANDKGLDAVYIAKISGLYNQRHFFINNQTIFHRRSLVFFLSVVMTIHLNRLDALVESCGIYFSLSVDLLLSL